MNEKSTGEFTFTIVDKSDFDINKIDQDYPLRYSENLCFIKAYYLKKERCKFYHIANFLISVFLEHNIKLDNFDSVVIDLDVANHYILVDSYAFTKKSREEIFDQIIYDLRMNFPLC